MNIETFHLPGFFSVIAALTAFLVIPAAAMAGSKIPKGSSAIKSDYPDGAACALPPTVELAGKTPEPGNSQLPPMDKKVTGTIKTATFAMG